MHRTLATILCLFSAMLALGVPCDGKQQAKRPPLQVGVWTNLTPPEARLSEPDHIFVQGMAVDPNDPQTLYLCVCAYDATKGGLYKTTDGGASWKHIGHLDEPIHVLVDPKNSRHLYCVDGVRGNTIGFWVSNDGGNNWTQPEGFRTATQKPVGTTDLYSIAADPTDFNHILVSFHSPWADGSNCCGILESHNGGQTWSVHPPPAGLVGGYGMAIFFLYAPRLKQGNSDTWLFTTQAGGFYRTTDAGKHWTQAYVNPMTHGGNQIYRASTGALFSGGYQYVTRSTDNGASWQQVKNGLTYSWYIGICGDGKNLYTGCSHPNQPMFTSPETDGTNWKAYGGGTQRFAGVPFEMAYDPKNHIVYSANWNQGIFALKTE